MPSVDLYSNFKKIELAVTSWSRHLSVLQNIVYIPKYIEPTIFKLGTNIQQQKVHLMIKVMVTLKDAKVKVHRK